MRLHSIKPYLIAFFLLVAASGCLKDSLYDNGTFQATAGGTTQVIGLGITATNVTGFLAYSVDASGNDTTIALVPVTLGGPTDATQDIHVTVIMDSTLVMAYDTAQSQLDPPGTSDYISPLPANFTIVNPGGVVTIPKGSRTGFLSVKFTPNNFLGADYAIGFRIKSVQESGYVISGNVNTGVIAIGVKNMYDGVYESAGEFIHPAYGDLTWDFSAGLTEDLVTTGPNSVSFYPFNTPVGAFGAEMDITVNSDGYTLTEVFNGNPTPTPNSDHYDASTRTFYVSGSYQGATGTRNYKSGTLTYIGPR